MNILNEIVKNKKYEVEQRKKIHQIDFFINNFPKNSRNFKEAIRRRNKINLIAEIKYKSPSYGIIRQDLDHKEIAKIYEKNGVSALSILTDKKYFGGKIEYIEDTKNVVSIPILMKDFIIDEYQIYEAKYVGANCLLLIVNILKNQLKNFLDIAKNIKIDSLVEVHNQEEIKIALDADAEIIGINNRNLETFEINLNTTLELVKYIPTGKIKISESGIKTKDDILLLQDTEIDAVLVGESLMRSKNISEKIVELLN